jgi:RNA polymerase sigma factor (sigma-70 family)
METKVLFNEYVAENYDKLKKIATNEARKKMCLEKVEDIFHDTLIKCLKQLNNKTLDENEILAYFTRSIQINLIRDFNYSYSLMKCDGVEINECVNEVDNINVDIIDYNNILQDIEKIFSQKEKIIFKLWTEGLTIKEINKKMGVEHSRYTVDKIKKWLKNKYEE